MLCVVVDHSLNTNQYDAAAKKANAVLWYINQSIGSKYQKVIIQFALVLGTAILKKDIDKLEQIKRGTMKMEGYCKTVL